jgi:hypothetical protein
LPLSHQRTRAASLVLAVALWIGPGCASVSPSRYVAPRVTGRVLDMENQQPLKDAQVKRVSSDPNTRSLEAPKGGNLLGATSSVRTGADGTFVIGSARTLSVLGNAGWYSVTLTFERAGYESVIRTYTLAQSTNTPSGEPWVEAGDVLLPRLAR